MKAAVIKQFGSMVVMDVPDPEPGEYEALCEILYGATCTGTDSHILDGTFPWISPLPTIPGHESVGRVVKVGRKVRNYRIGDLVTRVGAPPCPKAGISVTWGGYAEMGIARDHWAMCADRLPESEWGGSWRFNQVLPASVDPRAAPMFTTWRETLSYLTRMGVAAGSAVLVVGSGGNGIAYAAHALNMGARLVAMVGSGRLKDRLTSRLKLSAYVDHLSDDWAGPLRAACPEGFDFIIDAVGRNGVADRVLPCLRDGGKYGTYGLDDIGKISINPSRARGTVVIHPCTYDEAETHQRVCEMYLHGKLDVSLWYDVGRPYPLESINEAFRDLKERKTVKALIRMRG